MIIMNKKFLIWGIILIAGYILGTFVSPGSIFASKEKEFSHKTGNFESRYIKSFERAPDNFPEDQSDLVPGSGAKIVNVERLLNEAGKLAGQFEWFNKIQAEHAYVHLIELGNARLTVSIDNGEFLVQQGLDTSREPTLVVPLTESGVMNLVEILRDGQLSYAEQYMLYNALAVPGLKALYSTNPLYLPGDKSIFKFDDLVHVVIPPEETVLRLGVPLNIEVTAVNSTIHSG